MMQEQPHITILINGKMSYAFTANRYSCEQTRDGKFTMEADCPPIERGTDFGVPGQSGDHASLSEQTIDQLVCETPDTQVSPQLVAYTELSVTKAS